MVSLPAGYSTVAEVVRDNLCHSCGVCAGICPQNAVEFGRDARPVVQSHCNECSLCLQVCSGWRGTAERHDGDGTAVAYLAASSDETLRLQSSSGGLVTELLRFLLKSGKITAALVTVADKDNPARPVSILAGSEEQLLNSCQSRYALFPWGKTVKELLSVKEPYGVVGTSCQLASFHYALRLFPRLREYLVVTIGICCESNIEPEATDHLLRIRNVGRDQLDRIEFRSGKWPGVMSAFASDGSEVILSNRNRLEGAINYLKLCYGRQRCRYCGDVLCRIADITVGDPWGRDDDGKLVHRGSDGYSAALVRDKNVADWLHEMKGEKLISLKEKKIEDVLQVQLRQAAAGVKKTGRAAVSAAKKEQPYPMNLAGDPAGRSGFSVTERCSMMVEALAHREPFRSLLMRFFFSPLGDIFTKMNSRVKRRKAMKK